MGSSKMHELHDAPYCPFNSFHSCKAIATNHQSSTACSPVLRNDARSKFARASHVAGGALLLPARTLTRDNHDSSIRAHTYYT
jgi:hypothetical protein